MERGPAIRHTASTKRIELSPMIAATPIVWLRILDSQHYGYPAVSTLPHYSHNLVTYPGQSALRLSSCLHTSPLLPQSGHVFWTVSTTDIELSPPFPTTPTFWSRILDSQHYGYPAVSTPPHYSPQSGHVLWTVSTTDIQLIPPFPTTPIIGSRILDSQH
jgi:hypothetical protein